MENKDEKKPESSTSTDNIVNKTSKSGNDPLKHVNEVEEESNDSSEDESGSLRSSLVNTVATIQDNFFKKGKLLETWHQFLLTKYLYNKNYTHMDEVLYYIESKTTVKREEIFYAAIFLSIAYILLQNFDPLLCTIVSCLYPAYETTRSLTIAKTRIRKQREHWLIYWIVFSFFTLQDYYTEWLTKFFSPLLLLKMLFLMLLALPQTGIAELCYYNMVVPILSIINDAFVKYNRRSNGVGNVANYASETEEETQ